jgi:hypothetical protein
MQIERFSRDFWDNLLCQAADLKHWEEILGSGYILSRELRRQYESNPRGFNLPETKWSGISGGDETTFSNFEEALSFLPDLGLDIQEALIYGLVPPKVIRGDACYSDSDKVGPGRIGVNCLSISKLNGIFVVKKTLDKFVRITEPHLRKLEDIRIQTN